MDIPLNLSSAFLLGFFTTLHCVGMCGGIIAALSLGLSAEVRENKLKLLLFVGSYNAGRIISYSLAGLLAGALGNSLLNATSFDQGHQLLQYFAASMMIAIGLYLSGWLPQLAMVERLGLPLWKKLEPFGRRLLPISSPFKALSYGVIWGWLPCGMVYFVLLWALTAGSAIQGASLMLAFGLGTLPTLLAAGFMASWIRQFAGNTKIRSLVGFIIISMAVTSLFIPLQHQNNDENQNNQHDHRQHH